MTTPQQLIAEVRNKVYIAAPEDCWGGFIEACANLQPETKAMLREAPTDLRLLTDALEVALEALDENKVTLTRMECKCEWGKFAAKPKYVCESCTSIEKNAEAQTKITELIAKRGEA